MGYVRQCREFANKSYDEVERDEVKVLFDVLTDNSIDNIAKETGFGRDFVSKTIDEYLIKTKNCKPFESINYESNRQF